MSNYINNRISLEEREIKWLAPYASFSKNAKRTIEEDACHFRTSFQRDRDRIIHCKPFRRLKYKTQVFLAPKGDHYRTRLTHTLEVAQIARTLARALRLNEDLTEAISLGHDLGHTPFGHSGEEILAKLHPYGFKHYQQSLRVVEFLAKDGQGLNLTNEVKDGILKHSKGVGEIFSDDPNRKPFTLEGNLVRASDIIAYVCHDLEDALRAEVISYDDIPKDINKILGENASQRIQAMVSDIIKDSKPISDSLQLSFSKPIYQALMDLREFLYEKVYRAKVVNKSLKRCDKIIRELYAYFMENSLDLIHARSEEILPNNITKKIPPDSFTEEMLHKSQLVCDFIAGMTDRYALELYHEIFMPISWTIK